MCLRNEAIKDQHTVPVRTESVRRTRRGLAPKCFRQRSPEVLRQLQGGEIHGGAKDLVGSIATEPIRVLVCGGLPTEEYTLYPSINPRRR
jgi:hypothetical protein